MPFPALLADLFAQQNHIGVDRPRTAAGRHAEYEAVVLDQRVRPVTLAAYGNAAELRLFKIVS
jgi:hypothetical protein